MPEIHIRGLAKLGDPLPDGVTVDGYAATLANLTTHYLPRGVARIEELGIPESFVSVWCVPDILPMDGSTVCVTVFLYDKEERTDEVRSRLAQIVLELIREFLQRVGFDNRLTEVSVDPYDETKGVAVWRAPD